MNKEKIKLGLCWVIGIALLAFVVIFSANNQITEDTDIILLSQYVARGLFMWYIPLIGIAVETLFIKRFLKETYFKSVSMAIIMNGISAFLSIATLHIVGLINEVLFIFVPVGSFHVSHWVVYLILIVPMYALLEGLVLKIGFKQKFKKVFWWLCGANAIMVAVTFLFNLSWISEMFFVV